MRFVTLGTSLTLVFALALPGLATAYPEFEEEIEKTSKRNVNCAFCHVHPDGPDGVKTGQIGSFGPAELKALNKARRAIEPGGGVDSPILNDFGDHLINTLGKAKVVALMREPSKLGQLLGTSDLDGDGISDAEEYHDGTHPLIHHHGDPWKLFSANLQEYGFHLLMLVLATVCGIYGIDHLLKWFGIEAQRVLDDQADDGGEA